MPTASHWQLIVGYQKKMEQEAPDGMDAWIEIKLRTGDVFTPSVVQEMGGGWVAFETHEGDDKAKSAVIVVRESEIATIKTVFKKKATMPTGFHVGEIIGAQSS
jgi:hypothetical protein